MPEAALERFGFRRVALAALCLMAGAAFAGAAHADSDRGHRGAKRHVELRWYAHDRHRHGRHAHRAHERVHHDAHVPHGAHADWLWHGGRYWAPAHYKGRRCTDRRHHPHVHYHVLARDYYDYYYPRFRYYGPRPRDLSASVIITVPLF